MTAMRFQTGRRQQTSPASLWEVRTQLAPATDSCISCRYGNNVQPAPETDNCISCRALYKVVPMTTTTLQPALATHSFVQSCYVDDSNTQSVATLYSSLMLMEENNNNNNKTR